MDTCRHCGRALEHTNRRGPRGHYCNTKCCGLYHHHRRYVPKPKRRVVCATCGSVFMVGGKGMYCRRYCDSCRRPSRTPRL